MKVSMRVFYWLNGARDIYGAQPKVRSSYKPTLVHHCTIGNTHAAVPNTALLQPGVNSIPNVVRSAVFFDEYCSTTQLQLIITLDPVCPGLCACSGCQWRISGDGNRGLEFRPQKNYAPKKMKKLYILRFLVIRVYTSQNERVCRRVL